MFHQVRKILTELWSVTRQATGEAIGKVVVEGTVQKITIDKRAELAKAMKRLKKKDREVLWERYRKIPWYNEDRFASILIKIPEEDRGEMLEYLAHADEQEYQDALNLLEHNPIPQFIGRVRAWGKENIAEGMRIAHHKWASDEHGPGIEAHLWNLGRKMDDARRRQTWLK